MQTAAFVACQQMRNMSLAKLTFLNCTFGTEPHSDTLRDNRDGFHQLIVPVEIHYFYLLGGLQLNSQGTEMTKGSGR